MALGPLTNVALALGGAPALRHRVGRLVAVAGRRPGHIFHPAEGAGGGILFGHGPVFTDFNRAQDREATARVLGLGLPVTLVPYEAARQVTLDSEDLDRIAQASEAGKWVVERARGWLDCWRTDIGREGFYPFDLVGAAYVLRFELFDCARTRAWVTEDERLWGWVRTPRALLAGDSVGRGRSPGGKAVIYCQNIRSSMRSWLLDALTSGAGPRGGRESRAPSW